MVKNDSFIYIWANGHVAVLEEAKKCRLSGERPVLICLVQSGVSDLIDSGRRIGARCALDGIGELLLLSNMRKAREEIYAALSKGPGLLVRELVVCTDNLKKVLA